MSFLIYHRDEIVGNHEVKAEAVKEYKELCSKLKKVLVEKKKEQGPKASLTREGKYELVEEKIIYTQDRNTGHFK